jgi:osmoprotectant transport system permease protein
MNTLRLAWHWFNQASQWHGTDGIPHRLLEHLHYSLLSLAIAAVIALPLGMLTGHTGRGGFAAVTLANAARALPTVGVVVLVVITIGFGLTPVLVALTALALPTILVNTYEGIRTVDPDLKDAAKGMGMTGWQIVTRVEFPVALPLILLGVRTAAIQVVATATIAAYVGLGGLGRFIFDGLARRDYTTVVGGATAVALLAVLAEVVFVGVARFLVSPGVRRRSSTS